MTYKRDAAAEKRRERQKKRDLGLIQIEIWIYPTGKNKLKQFVKELNRNT